MVRDAEMTTNIIFERSSQKGGRQGVSKRGSRGDPPWDFIVGQMHRKKQHFGKSHVYCRRFFPGNIVTIILDNYPPFTLQEFRLGDRKNPSIIVGETSCHFGTSHMASRFLWTSPKALTTLHARHAPFLRPKQHWGTEATVYSSISPPFFAHPFFLFFALSAPSFPGQFPSPKSPSFWHPRSTLSCREKVTCRGLVLGTVLDGVAPQEKKENPFFLARKKSSISGGLEPPWQVWKIHLRPKYPFG